ncbi:MAG: hypothetical protein HY013_19895 [Candidatus Solibacter usitatus]|nr:hypothetical protein [Candidatus Solibacter usitatus]
MLTAIAAFELRRHLRAVSTYVYFLLFAALAFLLMTAAAGGFQSASVVTGTGGKVLVNSPYTLATFISILSYFGLLVISAITGKAAFQDFDHQTHSFFFTAPISKGQYLGGRFLAAILILLAIFSSVALGLALGTAMPFIDRARVGPNHLLGYVQPYLVAVLPNLLVLGALFFSLAALTRRILPVYMTSVILLVGYLIAATLTTKIENKFAAALLDPFGSFAYDLVTEYWTVSEKNTRLVGLGGALLWNRALWLAVAAAMFGFTYWRFQFVYALDRRKTRRKSPEAAVASPAVSVRAPLVTPVHSAAFPALARLTWLGFIETVKNIYFAVIVLAGILFMVFSARSAGSLFGTPTYPVTYQVLELMGGSFALFILIIITFYSGELVWRERDAGTHEMVDVLPLPGWAPWLSKLCALWLVQALLMAVVTATGMSIQLAKGYTRLEPALYLKELFGLRLIDYWLLCVLAMTVHTLVNNKYMGHFVMVLYYLSRAFLGQLGFEHGLYRYGSSPGYQYSDMNGFGHFLGPVFWFNAYWAACAVLLALAAHLFWVRGLAVEWRWRLALARGRLRAAQRWAAAGAGTAFLGLGGFIFYNTNVLNTYRTRYQGEALQARYEKEYRKYRRTPQPRITSVRFTADLYPERRSARIRGRYEIANPSSQPVQQVLVRTPEEMTVHRLQFTPAARLESRDGAIETSLYRMERPFEPGASGAVEFDLEYLPHGFQNRRSAAFLVYNGTFFNSGMLPHLGYEERGELSEDNTRRKHGLPPKERMADVNDLEARRNTYISNDSDWVTFEAVISTTPGQIAIAPGELVREWTEGGRRFFHYRTRTKTLNFFSVLSARYQVLRDNWNDVQLEIYYHPGHEYNLAKMMKGMKAALDYCTRNFTPYQHKTVRIVEFPRYATFAQSFPASIPYSEGIGFIARVNPTDEEDVDYPFYVTAHEVAHQWWAHQVIGGNVQGSTLMSESLSQYTALMVMKHEHGPEQMKRFLKYEMDRYLIGRSVERKKELPLVRVENQPYIHYNKASVVLYALQDYVGEDAVNRALQAYAQKVAGQPPPYTNSLELIGYLRQAVPPHLAYLIEDMFESITLYENRAMSASYREVSAGKYEVKLKVAARKMKAGELGEEREAPLADWIDIGVLDSKGKPLYLAKHKIERRETEFTLTVNQPPAKAGIDPLNKLVDRKPDDNLMTVSKQ